MTTEEKQKAAREYYIANRDRILQQKRERYETNHEQISEQAKKYYQNNLAYNRAARRVYSRKVRRDQQSPNEYWKEYL